MLTFEGKTFDYFKNKTKDPPNKEASPNRFLLEKLYRVHRRRVIGARPTIDSYVEVPDFFKNAQSAKEQAKEHQLGKIARENETIYKRIARAENAESLITKDTREHVKRVEHELVLMERLKRMGRARSVLRVNRENEDILLRIERARPEYSIKGMKEWYKHHELFKKGRKSDPTAGHLGFRGMKGLMPTSLPPVSFDPSLGPGGVGAGKSNIELAEERSQALSQKRTLTLETLSLGSPGSSTYSLDSPFASASSPMGSPVRTAGKGGVNRLLHSSDLYTSAAASASASASPSSASSPAASGAVAWSGGGGSPQRQSKQNAKQAAEGGAGGAASASVPSNRKSKRQPAAPASSSSSSSSSPSGTNGGQGKARRGSKVEGLDLDLDAIHGETYEQEVDEGDIFSAIPEDPDCIALVGKSCSVPFESTTVLMQLLVSRAYDECLLLRLYSSTEPHEVVGERLLDIDTAFEVFNSHSSIMLSSNAADLKSLRGQLVGLFDELDADHSGYLGFDEFVELMARCQVGIRVEDLRAVLADADADGNGVVEYSEFVPVAIDMILTFRIKLQAQSWAKRKEEHVENEVLRMMRKSDIGATVDAVQLKLVEADPKKTGSVRLSDLRKHLNLVSSKVGLTDVEIAYVLKHVTKEGLGRCKYDNISELLSRARFMLLKHGLLEETGSAALRYLLNVCRKHEEEEAKRGVSGDLELVPGYISLSMLTKVMKENERYPMTLLQASVLLSDPSAPAAAHSVKVDYYTLLPVLARAVELLADPHTLRQRAELIDPLGQSLDAKSLLEAQQKEAHISSPMTARGFKAKPSGSGKGADSPLVGKGSAVSASLTGGAKKGASPSSRTTAPALPSPSPSPGPSKQAANVSSFERRLRALFASSDLDHSGTLSPSEFTLALRTLDLHLTEDEISALIEQADVTHTRQISFSSFCVFFANNLASLERQKHMRDLHHMLHRQPGAGGEEEDEDEEAASLAGSDAVSRELSDHLLSVFRASDSLGSGLVDLQEFASVIHALDVDISDFQIDALVSEARLVGGAMVNYAATVPILVDLLRSFLSSQEASMAERSVEEEAARRAHACTLGLAATIYSVVSFIFHGQLHIDEEVGFSDYGERYHAFHALLSSPHSGLASTEATYLLSKLFSPSEDKYRSPSASAPASAPASASGGDMGATRGLGPAIEVNLSLHPLPVLEAHRKEHEEYLAALRHHQSRGHVQHHRLSIRSHAGAGEGEEMSPGAGAGAGAAAGAGAGAGAAAGAGAGAGASRLRRESMRVHPAKHTLPLHSSRRSSLAPGAPGTARPLSMKSALTNRQGSGSGSRSGSRDENDEERRRHMQPTPHRSLQEITDAVFDARKLTIQRGILQNVPVEAIQKVLLTALQHARDVCAVQGQCSRNSIYLPVAECYHVLETCSLFRLTQPQILGVMSWAEGYDPSSSQLDFATFADCASQIIGRLLSPNVQEARSKLVRMMSTSDQEHPTVGGGMSPPPSPTSPPRSMRGSQYGANNAPPLGSSSSAPDKVMARAALNNLTADELNGFLVSEFEAAEEGEHGLVSLDVFVDVISRVPLLKLTKKDALAVAAPFAKFAKPGTLVPWPEFVPFAFQVLASLCQERLLHRRMMLGGGGTGRGGERAPKGPVSTTDEMEEALESADGEALSHEAVAALKRLASGIIEHIEVRVVDDCLQPVLPGETQEEAEAEGGADDFDDHSLASLDSLEPVELEPLSISSPTLRAILQRRKPTELVLHVDEEGREEEEEEEGEGEDRFPHSPIAATTTVSAAAAAAIALATETAGVAPPSAVTAVELFKSTVEISCLVVATRAPAPAPLPTSASAPAPRRDSLAIGGSPTLNRRKTYAAIAPAAEPVQSRKMQVLLTVLCAEPEVLNFERALIVSASRDSSASLSLGGPAPSFSRSNSALGAMGNGSVAAAAAAVSAAGHGKSMSVSPFDVVSSQTIGLPSICLGA